LKNCKACSSSVRVSEEAIEEMLSDIIASGNFQLVEDEIYESRLAQCNECKYFQYGTTCLQCGCITQITAKLKESTCPYPLKSKWVKA
jgi:hypothetical protein